jgi:hypothetical protein
MQVRIAIMLEKEEYEQLHRLMFYSLQAEEGLIIYKIYKGKSKQGWYRQVLMEGVRALRQEFELKKRMCEQLPEEGRLDES